MIGKYILLLLDSGGNVALNSTLVRAAGGVLTAIGGYSAMLPGTPACKLAIQFENESMIKSACGPFFGNEGLVVVIIFGGLVLFFTSPLKDLADYLFSSVKNK